MNDSELNQIWEKFLQNIQESISTYAYDSWIKHLQPVSLTPEVFTLAAPNDITKKWVDSHYIAQLVVSCYIVTQHRAAIEIIVSKPPEQTATVDNSKDAVLAERQKAVKKRGRSRSKEKANNLIMPTLTEAIDIHEPATSSGEVEHRVAPGDASTLNPRYIFETFVIGNSNQFAHAAALAIAENPATAYNPFFMYGGVGVGKTHLMHAIGHRILKEHPEKSILYTTAEKFTNELIHSIRSNKPEAFRQKYRNIDVLMIDDVQFWKEKEHSQEEFFHTFNELKEANKQIILSSDQHPRAIKNLADRLKSRFEGGLIIDIHVPDLETRIAILKKKAMIENVNVPNEVLTYIASNIDDNIRELEGALTRVIAYASINHSPITYEFAIQNLQGILHEANPVQVITVGIPLIQEVISKYFKITLTELNGKKRNRNIAYPRQIAMYLARELTGSSLPRIGNSFGGRDHTTVLHACDKIKKQIAANTDAAELINELRQKIQGA